MLNLKNVISWPEFRGQQRHSLGSSVLPKSINHIEPNIEDAIWCRIEIYMDWPLLGSDPHDLAPAWIRSIWLDTYSDLNHTIETIRLGAYLDPIHTIWLKHGSYVYGLAFAWIWSIWFDTYMVQNIRFDTTIDLISIAWRMLGSNSCDLDSSWIQSVANTWIGSIRLSYSMDPICAICLQYRFNPYGLAFTWIRFMWLNICLLHGVRLQHRSDLYNLLPTLILSIRFGSVMHMISMAWLQHIS